MKGSYYANPLVDLPDVSDELRSAHPESALSSPACLRAFIEANESRYYSGNVWPRDVPQMREFESTFKAYVP